MRADLFKLRKMYPEAIAIYEELLKKEPKNAALLNKIGVAYSTSGNLDKARRYYERSIKADKTFPEPINNLGTVYYEQKKFKKAIKLYQRGLQLAPEMATLHSNLGYALFGERKYEEAILSFQRAIQLDPASFEHHGASSGTLLQDRSVEDRPLFFYLMAKSFAGMNNAARCAFFLRRAIEEGYKNIAAVEKDPAFAKVINDPLVRDALQTPPPAPATKPTS